jgi:D-sedoheptulose 7-phosphate isomerase
MGVLMNGHISDCIEQHIEVARSLQSRSTDRIADIAQLLIQTVRRKGTIFWCGNGGSAADSQHLAAELIGRFKRERPAIASLALTTDTSALTAIGNDYSYADVFKRQVEGLVRDGDALIGISTSGNSENVILAVRAAKARGAKTIALVGRDGGRLKEECDRSLVVPSSDTARIQEGHIMVGHILCDLIEREFTAQ